MPDKRPRLVTIGDLTLDIVVRPRAGAETGTDVPATIAFRAGGSAANTARAFAGLGGAATFIGAVGDDRPAGALRSVLRSAGVTAHLVTTRGVTARLIVLIAPDGERSFLTDRGVADSLAWRSIRPAWLARAEVLHLPAYSLLTAPLSDSALQAARRVRAAGGLVSVDLASRRPLLAAGPDIARARIAAAGADVLFANRDEAAVLFGRRGWRRLAELAPIAAVKAGGAGCTVLWRRDTQEVLQIDLATRQMAAADTTGAGDAFDAGFLHALLVVRQEQAALRAADLRRAALAGLRTASAFLRRPRRELVL